MAGEGVRPCRRCLATRAQPRWIGGPLLPLGAQVGAQVGDRGGCAGLCVSGPWSLAAGRRVHAGVWGGELVWGHERGRDREREEVRNRRRGDCPYLAGGKAKAQRGSLPAQVTQQLSSGAG